MKHVIGVKKGLNKDVYSHSANTTAANKTMPIPVVKADRSKVLTF